MQSEGLVIVTTKKEWRENLSLPSVCLDSSYPCIPPVYHLAARKWKAHDKIKTKKREKESFFIHRLVRQCCQAPFTRTAPLQTIIGVFFSCSSMLAYVWTYPFSLSSLSLPLPRFCSPCSQVRSVYAIAELLLLHCPVLTGPTKKLKTHPKHRSRFSD